MKIKPYKQYYTVDLDNGASMLIQSLWDDEKDCPSIRVSTTFKVYDSEDGSMLVEPAAILGYEFDEDRDRNIERMMDVEDVETRQSLENMYDQFKVIVKEQIA